MGVNIWTTWALTMIIFPLAAIAAAGEARPAKSRPDRQSRPVIRGRSYAVSSMRPESTQVAERILRAGGNAFDAAVAAQAVLALVDAPNNGVGSDAMLLVYDAQAGRAYSVNAEGTAPQLATIDWYNTASAGQDPGQRRTSFGDDAGRRGRLVHAARPLGHDAAGGGCSRPRSRWRPTASCSTNGWPHRWPARSSASNPTTVKAFSLDRPWEAGAIYKVPQLARTLSRLVEAEQEAAAGGRRAALKAARDRFYKGDIAREMAEFSEQNGGLFRYEDFAAYSAIVEAPVSIDYRGYQVLKDRSANQGPAELFALNILETFDLKTLGHNSAEYIHAGVEAVKLAFADREYLGDDRFIKIPWETLLSKEYAGAAAEVDRPRPGLLRVPAGADRVVHPSRRHRLYRTGRRRRRYQLPVHRRPAPQRGVVHAQPAHGLRNVRRDGGARLHLQLPRRLLLARSRPPERPGARQTAAQHAAIDSGPQERPAVPGDGQPGRRRPVPADPADVAQHGGVRDERAAGDRGAALVHAQLSAVLLPAHDVSRRDER